MKIGKWNSMTSQTMEVNNNKASESNKSREEIPNFSTMEVVK